MLFCGVCAFSAAAVSARGGSAYAAENATYSKVEYETSYAYGSELAIADESLTVGGKQEVLNKTLIYPSKKAVSTDKVVLNEFGKYTIRYSKVIDGKYYQDEYAFGVDRTAYSVSNGCSAEYTNLDNYDYISNKSTEGLKVTLNKSGTFTYNNYIDLNNLGEDNLLLSLFALPQEQGTRDFGIFNIRIIDAFDETNYIQIRVKAYQEFMSSGEAFSSYILAAVPSIGQNLTSKSYTQTYVNDWGRYTFFSFSADARGNGNDVVKNALAIHYDQETKQLIIPHNIGWDAMPDVIADFDDPAYFSDSVWDGFSTSKVVLSVSIGGLAASSGSFMINYIDGQDLSDPVFSDMVPELVADLDGYEEDSLPFAEVGKPYSIFPLTAQDDVDGNMDAAISVTYNKNGKDYDVNVENGAFVPYAEGEYKITYKAVTTTGQVESKVLTVVAKAASALNVNFSADNGEYLINQPYTPIGYTATNAYGKTRYDIVITDKNNSKYVWDEDFLFQISGEHVVEYTVYDYAGRSATHEFRIQVGASTEPTWVGSPAIPKYMLGSYYCKIDGAKTQYAYEIKPLLARFYDADGNMQEKTADIYFDGKKVENGKIAPQITAGSKPQIKVIEFKAEFNGTTYTSETYTTIVVSPTQLINGTEYLSMTQYFVGEGLTNFLEYGQTSKKFLEFVASGDGANYVDFVNPVGINKAAVEFNIDPAKTSFEKIRVTAYDSVETDKAIYADYYYDSDKKTSYMTVNSNTLEAVVSGSLIEDNQNNISFRYDIDTRKVSGYPLVIKTYADGTEFDEFPSGKVYLRVELIGAVKDKAAVRIMKIDNQIFHHETTRDRVAPTAMFVGGIQNSYVEGETVVISEAIVSDVLSPYSYASFSVKNRASGEYVTDANGVLLKNVSIDKEYSFVAQIATYELMVSVGDGTTTDTYKQVFSGVDVTKPTMTVKGGVVGKAKVGETYRLPEFTLSDNFSSEENCDKWIVLYFTNGRVERIDSNVYVFSTAGEYVLGLFGADESGNTVSQLYKLIVE